MVEEPLTLEMQTANEVRAPESPEEGSKSMASGVRGNADTQSHCRLLKTHSRVPIQLSEHFRVSEDCSVTLHVTQLERFLTILLFFCLFCTSLTQTCEKHLRRNERTPDSPRALSVGILWLLPWGLTAEALVVMGISSLIYSDNCKTCYVRPRNISK